MKKLVGFDFTFIISFGLLTFLTLSYNACSPDPYQSKNFGAVSASSEESRNGSSEGDTSSDSGEDPSNTEVPAEEEEEEVAGPEEGEVDESLSFYFGNADITNAGTPAFLAIGHLKSSMYSCDGGATWKGYQTSNPADRCWQEVEGGISIECDHQSTSALTASWGPDGFMAAFGWGAPGSIQLTKDGETWETLKLTGVGGQSRFPGVAYGDGLYALSDPYRPIATSDGGMTFLEGSRIDSDAFNQRRTLFFSSSGLFASLSESGSNTDIMVSSDGLNYVDTDRPADCGNGFVAQSPSRIVLLSRKLCTSDDGGQTWVERGEKPFNSDIIYNGTHFIGYVSGLQKYSEDGITWSDRPIFLGTEMASSLRLSKITYHPVSNKYVAILQGSPRYYEFVQYYHSDDGVNWKQVDKEAGDAPVAPHPIRHITTGFIPNCE